MNDLDVELDRLRDLARRRYRRRLWVSSPVVLAGLVAFIVLIPDAPKRKPDGGVWIHVADGALLAFLLGWMAFVVVKFRRGLWRPTVLVRPSVLLGLPRRQRRQAVRDIRRGTPNRDAYLRAIEQAEVERLRPLYTMTRWSAPFLIVYFASYGARNVGQGDHRGWIGVAAAVMFAAAAVWSVPYVRGMRAFG